MTSRKNITLHPRDSWNSRSVTGGRAHVGVLLLPPCRESNEQFASRLVKVNLHNARAEVTKESRRDFAVGNCLFIQIKASSVSRLKLSYGSIFAPNHVPRARWAPQMSGPPKQRTHREPPSPLTAQWSKSMGKSGHDLENLRACIFNDTKRSVWKMFYWFFVVFPVRCSPLKMYHVTKWTETFAAFIKNSISNMSRFVGPLCANPRQNWLTRSGGETSTQQSDFKIRNTPSPLPLTCGGAWRLTYAVHCSGSALVGQ